LRPDLHYAYVLKVQDENGKWDETNEQVLALKVMTDEEMAERQRQRSDKEKRMRPLHAPTSIVHIPHGIGPG
jgi:hypothetical protein